MKKTQKIERVRAKSYNLMYRLETKFVLRYPMLSDLKQKISEVNKKIERVMQRPKLVPKQNIKKLTIYEKTLLKN